MILLIHGEDADKARAKTAELVGVLSKKRPDAEIFDMDASAEKWSAGQFDSFLTSQGLFDKKLIIVLRNVCTESEEIAEHVGARLSEAGKSENVFIFVERKLSTSLLAQFKKSAEKFYEVKSEIKKEWKGAGDFAIAEAFGMRDRARAWSLYQRSLADGTEPEKIHGLIFWQLKTILLAASAKSAAETDLKPFVFSKAKNFARNFSLDELRAMSRKLVGMYHEARQGGTTLESGLERFLLEK